MVHPSKRMNCKTSNNIDILLGWDSIRMVCKMHHHFCCIESFILQIQFAIAILNSPFLARIPVNILYTQEHCGNFKVSFYTIVLLSALYRISILKIINNGRSKILRPRCCTKGFEKLTRLLHLLGRKPPML